VPYATTALVDLQE